MLPERGAPADAAAPAGTAEADACRGSPGCSTTAISTPTAAKAAGRPIVGILCEYTPRELIMAAGGVPVCLCGGSAETIPAAEEHLPANLCPLIKSTFGYHVQRSNPFLEMADLVVAETTCDGKKKMYELMAESRPMYVLELPQKPDDPDALEHWLARAGEVPRRFWSTASARRVTDDRLREAIARDEPRAGAAARAGRADAGRRPAADRPATAGPARAASPASRPTWTQYEQAAGAAARGSRPEPASAARVRVLLTGVPMVHGAERVLDIIENSGGLVVCMENCTGLKPILEDVDAAAADPLRALAEKYFHLPCSVMTPNDRRLDVAPRSWPREYRPRVHRSS